MFRLAAIFVAFLYLTNGSAQPNQPKPPTKAVKTLPRKQADAKPECAKGAICFSGEVSEGQEFRRAINPSLDFELREGGFGWVIAIIPHVVQAGCDEFVEVANSPYHAHRGFEIDAMYDWTAEDEVRASPREFEFVTTCADLNVESERLQKVLRPASDAEFEEVLKKFLTSPMGKGRLWITGSRITHSRGLTPAQGALDWMAFNVELKLPH